MFHEPRFWTALAFILFFVIFGRKIWPALTGYLDARADDVRRDLDEAARLRREAEQMLEDATREREKTLAETQAMIANSEAEAAALAERARRESEEAAARYEKMARDRIDAAQRAAIREIQECALQIAVSATREVVASQLSEKPEVASSLVEKSIASLPDALRRSAA
ncbi:F0F1 ATP synthase subunit B family protein [Gluconobacter morbifer]|uniref:ATP synthase subunit b n=1 Tax=Gluconobacter morbifer G707 TaxID=1088869 RepID=G6XKI9_9PROT|nr:ATP synthase subunit B [Gluconobacter morbifer]EHH67785.1 hypothetical protein GMO_20050 [Gluconobacter morbifer G707]